MITYSLHCEKGHAFDAWFRSAAAFEQQRADGVLACPVCDSRDIAKAMMAPALGRSHDDADRRRKLMKALKNFREKAIANSEDVGTRFAEEARRIHFEEVEPRAIRGEASREEVAGLVEDGVSFMPLPTLPDEQN